MYAHVVTVNMCAMSVGVGVTSVRIVGMLVFVQKMFIPSAEFGVEFSVCVR